ncbi:molybdopterin-dependent aldehyde oxidoreductase [Candidatus Formimonas warabiya]|uniref:Aldehyde oxidoreductase n=1 Tax=Formimonas warabiya TaxID=1761012 RepID=A0A3G1KU90_FORW1|nr:molybdopterin-dependent aldehyde oxidoreductase [Candidatus Formimonas warabiya]ATW25745.1 aldehyde oxidoreductase [Candidatus Formimonas warabiya]
MKILYRKELIVNGKNVFVMVDPEDTLAQVLRTQLHLLGTKIGCNAGQCGVCSVLLDGKVVRSCSLKMKRVPEEANIVTIEGIGTPDHLHPLQLAFMKHGAAQCGFCSPGFIVSAKGLLDQNASPTRAEVRDWFQKHRNACRCTGYRPIVDAVMDAAQVLRGERSEEDLKFKLPPDGKIFGTDMPRPSAAAKVTGTCDYGADLGQKLPEGTLHLALVQAQVSHAKILSIDTSAAEMMPGVEAVLTYKDVKGSNRINGLVVYPWNQCNGFDRPILCDEKIYQFGDALAIVCADTIEHARAAADKVKVEVEELPAYMDALEAAAEDAMEIHPGTPNVFFEQPTVKGGETKPLLEKAAYVVSAQYYLQRQPHLVLEPDVGFAYYDAEERLTIHSKSVALYCHADMIFEGLGIEREKLRLIQNNAGGTFGYKLSPTLEAILGVAVMSTGKPVYLEYNMYQQITYTGKRSPFFVDLTMGADKDGKLLAMEYDFIVDHGAYSEFGDLLCTKGNQLIGAGYKIDHIRGRGRVTFTNHAFGSAFRAYGSPQSFFASESCMDELAYQAGLDPFEFRYRNLYREGDTTPTGCRSDVYTLPQLFDALRPVYYEAKERAEQESTPDIKRGVGISLGIYVVGNDSADVAEAAVELLSDGKIAVYHTWEDHGQGSDMGALASAHEALFPLNIKPEQIKLVMNDTACCPDSGMAAGSRSQVMVGNAIADACQKLIDAMKKEDGTYRTYGEMVAEEIPAKYTGNFATGHLCTILDPKTGQFNPYVAYMYGVFVSEVEVDIKTGKTKVLKMTAGIDIGKIANKTVVDGQVLGGLAQGIGLALSEDFEDIHRHTTLIRCGLPFIEDVPDELNIYYLETPREHSVFGCSGVGEAPLTSPHASIINAIYHACGVRIRYLPALPEKILAGLKDNHQE